MNQPGSREKITFGHRKRDVLQFELLSNDLILAKLRGQSGDPHESTLISQGSIEDNDYWTLMDTLGNIQSIPHKMKKILNNKNWTKIQSKCINVEN